MKQNAYRSVQNVAIVVGLLLAFASTELSAQSRVKGEYAQTRQPISAVGQLNAELSKLCRRGMFRQRQMLRLSIGYVGPDGKGITGIAQLGFNLYDPLGKAEPRKTYHFHNQGYSNCRVYVANQPRQRPRQ